MEDQIRLRKYIKPRKKLYKHILKFIESERNDDFDQFRKKIEEYFENKGKKLDDLKQILILISNISKNHHKNQYFQQKIEQIISYMLNISKTILTNSDIFEVFKTNKKILLYLIKNEFLTVDDSFVDFAFYKKTYRYFFYPEIKPLLWEEQIVKIEKKLLTYDPQIFSTFEEKRQIGENDSYICSLIRNDLVEEFIIYVNKNSISLSSSIRKSIFETNSFLIKNENVTLIKYAAFFGSIQILQYLKMKNVHLCKSLWIYAIHSDNPELIHFLEENKVIPLNSSYEECYKESIKCHHNNIAQYISSNFLDETKFNENINSFGLHYSNYLYFPNDFNSNNSFFYLCKYNYNKLVKLYIHRKKKEFESKLIFTICFS